MSDSIKIIVRVRPFNSNEQGQSNVVQMEGQQVRLKEPQTGQYRKFGFHRCYWSTDDTWAKPPVNNMFVFNDIGKQVLENIYQGFNSTIFAYGQTGSGKSYSIEGYEQKGLLQLCLQDIFNKKMPENKANGIATSVRVTYLQIYNEKLRDLLNPNNQQELKVQSAGNAVHIQGVNPVLCQSYEQVQKMFKDGKKIRVIGAHAMNKNSSRSHAVFTIYYNEAGQGKMIKAKFNIVDLAGSERQSKTGATGVRLQQANNINKSLTNLGIVIQALAKNCEKKTKDFVPYRNSLLTHILSQSLAGNSKTFMIAAISPAASNYEETLSTLRFAQRASMISTQTKKNVQAKQGYNKQLLQEIERLRKQLQNASGKTNNIHTHSHSVDVQYITIQDQNRAKALEQRIAKMMQELMMNKTAMEQLQKQLEQQRKRKAQMQKNREKALKQAGLSTGTQTNTEDNKNLPYIMNISEDPTLAGMLIYYLKDGETSIGTNQAEQNQIKLNALGINKRHCNLINQKGQIWIIPKPQAKLFVNGLVTTQKTMLKHLDRITLGHANTFKLVIPGHALVDDLRQSMAFGGQYGEFLDDRLSQKTAQNKNTKIFLDELKHRLPKNQFAKFIEKFKDFFNDVDEANDYTAFRYKKYPLKSRNIEFRINVIIDIQNYMKGVPQLIIICEHKESKQVQFIWSQQKFQSRLAEMQNWYSDVSGNKSQSSYYQFDPWFDATDNFIKEKEKLQTMKAKQMLQFFNAKQSQNSSLYKQLLAQQRQILTKFKAQGIKQELVQDYADYYFRGYETPQSSKKKIEEMRKNQQIHTRIKRFMQCCAQVQKCNIDNKAFNQAKQKYSSQNKKNENSKSSTSANDQGLLQQNMWLNQKIQELEDQLKKRTKQLHKLKK